MTTFELLRKAKIAEWDYDWAAAKAYYCELLANTKDKWRIKKYQYEIEILDIIITGYAIKNKREGVINNEANTINYR